jgi:hypothetical protein
MAENSLLELSQDIGQLFSTGDNYDVIIQAGVPHWLDLI